MVIMAAMIAMVMVVIVVMVVMDSTDNLIFFSLLTKTQYKDFNFIVGNDRVLVL